MKKNLYTHLTNVVGVTFDNEDGTNRQDIIKRICKDDTQNEHLFLARLENTTYVNPQNVTERAIAVYAGKEQLGFIRHDFIEQMPDVTQVVAIASYFPKADKYTVNLYTHEKPSSKQYSYVKRICNMLGCPLPVYTRQAYTRFITDYENNKKRAS